MKLTISTKRLKIDQAQSTTIMVLAIAVVVTIFCLVSAKTLWSQASFQRHVINARHEASKQLTDDVTAAGQLAGNYSNVFANPSTASNVLGGKNTTSDRAVPPDGDNARIVLDALPSNYDFPALISSVSIILSNNRIANPSISGSDQAASAVNTPSTSPQPVAIQLTISGTSTIANVKHLISDLEHSIRPFDVTNLQLRGTNSSMSVSMNLKTYYQSATSLTIGTKAVQ